MDKYHVKIKIAIGNQILGHVQYPHSFGSYTTFNEGTGIDFKLHGYQKIYEIINRTLRYIHTDTKMKYYKVIAAALLLYASKSIYKQQK